MFKTGQKVRRNPRIWKKDTTVFTVVRIESGRVYIQKPGKTDCPWTGKLVPHEPVAYQTNELIPA